MDYLKRLNQIPTTETKPTTPAPQTEFDTYSSTPEKWYSGLTPTRQETLGKIASIYREDKAKGMELYNKYYQLQNDKSSIFYRQYAQPTNQAVQNLQALGFDTSVLNDAWFAQNDGWIRSHLNTSGTTNTPSSSVKKKSWEEQVAYQLYQYQRSEAQTKQAEKEYQAAMDEAKYWTNFGGKNYSDQQVYDKVREDFEKKYPTLSKMESEQYRYAPIELNRAVDWSDDAIYGAIWEARNPEYNGGIEGALACRALGEGNQWQENQEITALLNPQDPKFQPYATGGTADKAFRVLGITNATNEWIDENSHLLYDGTPEQQEAMKSLISANDFTNEAETAIAALDSWIESKKGRWTSFDKAKADLDELLAGKKIKIRDGRNRTEVDISALNKLDASIGKDGKVGTAVLLPTTRSLNYKYADVLERLQQIVDDNTKVPGSLESLNSMQGYVTSTTSDYAKAQEANWARGQEAKANAGKGKQPEQPANIQPFTEDQIALEKAGRDKIMDAADVVEDIATEDEQSVMRKAGTPSFTNIKDMISTLKSDPVSVEAWTGEAETEASKTFFDTNTQYLYDVARYLNTQQNAAAYEKELEKFTAKWGDINGYKDAAGYEFRPERSISIGDNGLHAVVKYDEAKKEYVLTDLYDEDGNDYVEQGENFFADKPYGTVHTKDSTMAAVDSAIAELNDTTKRVMDAQQKYASASKEEKDYINQMRVADVRYQQAKQDLETGKEAFNENVGKIQEAFDYIARIRASAEWLGQDTSAIDKMEDMLEFVTEYYDQPQMVCTSDSNLKEYEDLMASLGKTLTDENKKQYLQLGYDTTQAEIDKINDALQYMDENGFVVPDVIRRNMQFRLKDLQYQQKSFEYEKILTDTDPKELAKTIETGKQFEQMLADTYQDNDVDPLIPQAYGFKYRQEYRDDEKEIYYYLLGKSVEQYGGEWEKLKQSMDSDDIMNNAPAMLNTIMTAGGEYLSHLADDDYGVLTSRLAENTAKEADEITKSSHIASLGMNLWGTLETPTESLMSALYMLNRAVGDEQRINPKSQFRNITIRKESTRAATYERIDKKFENSPAMKTIARLGYEIYCNRGDSLMNSIVFGQLVPGDGILSNIAGAGPMGATAALTAAAKAVENGASVEQAWLIAGATFFAETVSEGVTYSNIQAALGHGEELTKDTVKAFIKDWLTRSGVEEVIGEMFNNDFEAWADKMVMGENSEYAKRVEAYKAMNMTQEQAEARAFADQLNEDLHTAIVSYLSAGSEAIMAVGKASWNTGKYYRTVTRALQQTGHGEVSMLSMMKNDIKGRFSRTEDNTNTEQKTGEESVTETKESPVAHAEGESTAAPENNIRKEAATDIVTLEKTKKADLPAQTAALASVLETGKGDTVSSDANAAAVFMTGVMGEDATTTVQQVLLGAGWANVDQTKVKQALQNAALGNGLATALVQTDTFKTANAQQKAQMLVDTLEQDNSNPNVRRNVSEKVRTFNQTMNGANQAAVQGLFDQAAKSKQEAQRAAMETAQAEQMLDEANQKLEAAKADVQQKSDAVVQNPSDDNVKQQADAVTKMNAADEVRKQNEQHLDNQKQAQQEKEAKARKDAEDAMNASRQTGEQAVNQMEQQKAEQQAKIESEEQYKQALHDNGVIHIEDEADDDIFGSEETQAHRYNANFSYDDDSGEINVFNSDYEQELIDAGFHKVTWKDFEGETHEYYAIDHNDISVEALTELNNRINTDIAERNGTAQEAREDAAIEQAVAKENVEGVEAENLADKLKERKEKIKMSLRDLKKPVSSAEGYLAIAAFERKLGIKINLEDMGQITPEGWTRGKYADGVITLNKNMTLGQALVEAALHEITHSMKNTNAYKTYRDVALNSVFGATGDAVNLYNENEKFRAKVDQTITDREKAGDPNFVGKSKEAQIAAAEEEIIADFARFNLAEKDVVQRFMDAGMGGRMRNMLHNINQALKNYFSNMTDKERETAEYLRRAERAFQKAMNEVAKSSVHPEESQFSIMQIAQATGMTFNENTLQLFDKDGNEIDGVNRKITPEMIRETPVGMLIENGLSDKPGVDENGNQTDSPRVAASKMMADLMNMVARYKDSNLVWEIGATTLSSTFSALKSNSDPQYKTTVDFGTVCAKTQAIIDTLSQVMLDRVKEGKYGGLDRKDIMKVYDAVNQAGLSVPCPVCYVFSRWMGVPSLLGQMSQYQHDYVALNEDGSIDKKATQRNVDKYIKTAEQKYGDAKAINNQKTKLQNKLVKLEEKRIDLEAQKKAKGLTEEQKTDLENQLNAVLDEQVALDKQLGEVNAYNWITQALCKKDKKGKYVVDDKFQLTPDEILFDLNRTGEFAGYEKNWRYRNTRGAGMGKAIMPYSGETIGDILYGVKKNGRQSAIKNPWLNMDSKAAAKQLREAQARAIKQNLVGGQRLQSTSDFRPEWGLDYIMSFLELQSAGSKVQMYTKVAEAVDFFASVGADVNMSIMGKGQGWHIDENGNYVLDFSNVTGMDYDTAKALKDKYDNVQMILVGMNDTHIRLAIANSDIDFVIPWHSSGNSKDVISGLMSTFKETLENGHNYEDSQNDTFAENRTDEQKALWDARMKLLTKGGKALTEADRLTLLSNDFTKDLYIRFTTPEGQKGYDPDCYNVKLSKEQAKQIFPYEYWDTSLTKDQADENGNRFIKYCEAMGIVPRFSQFKDDKGYWKLLIDRPMYNNDGSYHQQQVIDVTNARIGDLNEAGQLENSDLPTQAQAKYAPKDPRNANFEKYTAAQQQAVENAEAMINEQYDDGSDGQLSVYGDMTEADRELLRQTNEDYMDAVSRGDMVAAEEDVKFAAEQAGYTDSVYHGTPAFGFTTFNGDIYVSYNRSIANGYTGDYGNRTRDIGLTEQYRNVDSIPIEELAEYAQKYLKTLDFGEVKSIEYNPSDNTYSVTTNFANLNLTNNLDEQDIRYYLKQTLSDKQRSTYSLFAKPGKQLVIDADYSDWQEIPVTSIGLEGTMTTNEIAQWAKSNGYDSVRINNVYDSAEGSDAGAGSIGVFFNPNDVKSADPVTYDDNGNVIPLSERFNSKENDMRLSTGGDMTEADLALLNDSSIPDNRTTIYINDGYKANGETVDFINLILDGLKTGETRTHPKLSTRQWLGIAKDGYVYGKVKLGKPYEITKDSPEYKTSFIKGVKDEKGNDFDIKDNGTKWYYPIEAIEDFRDNPQPVLINGNYGKYSTGGDYTDADLDLLLGRSGAMSQEDIDAYHDKTSRPLEGKSAKWRQSEGPAERAFGAEGGMLAKSDEFNKAVIEYVQNRSAYFPDTNMEQIHRAVNWIGKNGFAQAFEKVTGKSFDYRSADGQARMVAMMGVAAAMGDDGVLYQAQLADAFDRQGTDLGRALQARKLFMLMTPAGRRATLKKMMRDQTAQFTQKGIDVDLKFSDWVMEAAAYAQSEEEFRQVQAAAAAELATQLPISWKERLNSLRMLSMLANPRTHIRNIIGNALFVPAVGLKNKIGALIEKGFVKEGERTKTLRLVLPSDIRQFAIEDARTMKDTLTGEAKYEQGTMVAKAKKPLGDVGSFLSEVNSNFLEGEDWFFLRGHYRKALGGWMVANGYTVDQVKNDPALLEKGRAYAIEEAQKATYRDFNGVAKKLNELSRNPQTTGQKILGFGIDAVLPFKKTPANILKRGIEYSPIGLARGVANLARGFNNGTLTANQVIDRISSGLSGTAVMALGFLLSGTGAVSCGFDDDDWDEELKGRQKYSIRMNLFGRDVTYTMDWAAPMAMPFFVGAAIRDQADNEGWDFEKVLNAMSSITEPVFNLSMLDGVNSLLKVNSYSNENPMTQIFSKIATNYATSYVPSVFGAIARTIDDTQRKSFVTKGENTGFMGGVRYAWEQVENKLPGVSQTNIPVRDVWGNAKTSSFAERLIENFISPGYIEDYQNDPVVYELGRLFDSTQAKALEPKHADTSIKVGNETHNLDPQQFDTFDRVHGETQYKLLKELFNNKTYQQMTDDDAKAEIVSKVYEYANKVAKNAVFPEYTYDIETVESLMQSGLATEYSQKMMKALEQGDVQSYDDFLDAYADAVGDENEAYSKARDKIRNKYSEEYKQAYQLYLKTGEKQYEDKMSHIEELLDDSGFDFKIADWESSVEEKLGY